MAYSKQTWKDYPDLTTPITSDRLNHIEDGISSIESEMDKLSVFTYVKYNGSGEPVLSSKDQENLKENDYYMDMDSANLYQYNGSEFALVGNVDNLGLKFYVIDNKLYYGGYATDSFSEIQLSQIVELIKTLGLDHDTWSSTKTYSIGDIETFNYKLYENITGNNSENPPTMDTTNWKLTSILVDE